MFAQTFQLSSSKIKNNLIPITASVNLDLDMLQAELHVDRADKMF